MTPRPVIYVLAGVNGAGKSSIGGYLLRANDLSWFNPDTYARRLVTELNVPQDEANRRAWHEGVRRLDEAIAKGNHFAFETTLGGNTIANKLKAAAATHDAIVWFCGLASAEQHIARVKLRVSQGGHDIPEATIRERFQTSREHLIELLPYLAELQVYDNSTDAQPGEPVPDPRLILHVRARQVIVPGGEMALSDTPDWAQPIVKAALAEQSARA